MKLNPLKFNRLINSLAQSFLWRKGFACPCINPNSGQPKINCTHCHGKGRFWSVGVPGLAAVVGSTVGKKQVGFGLNDNGDVTLTLPSDSPLYNMGQYDRIVAVNRTEPFSINLVAGINDKIRFASVSIDRAVWLVGDDLIDGDIPAVAENGDLVWSGLQPPAKTTYSLTGRRHPEYFCYDEIPLDRAHQQGVQLPRRVVVRRFDQFGN